MERSLWQQGFLINISRSLFYLRKMDPFISLGNLGNKWMFLIIQAGNRNWNLAANFGRKIVVQEAMRKSAKEPSQRKEENQRCYQITMRKHRKKLPIAAHHVKVASRPATRIVEPAAASCGALGASPWGGILSESPRPRRGSSRRVERNYAGAHESGVASSSSASTNKKSGWQKKRGAALVRSPSPTNGGLLSTCR